MSDELGKALLGKDGLQAGQIDAIELEKLRRKVALGHKRVRRLRWVIAVSWAWAAVYVVVFRVFMFSAAGSGAIYPPPALRPWQLIMLWLAGVGFFMIPVAVVSTVSYFVRSRELSMAEVQLRLARLEELLQRPPQKQS